MKNGDKVKVAGTTYILTNMRVRAWRDPITGAFTPYKTFTYVRAWRRA